MDKEPGAGTISLERAGPIASLVLDHPARRNAMTQAMWESLPVLCRAIEQDADCLVVILRGAGGHFCAGADISEFDRLFGTADHASRYGAMVQGSLDALRTLDRPVIAQIEGHCFGGGVSLLTQCDLVFAANNAAFGITPSKLGLIYGQADTSGLVSRVGLASARDLLFSARSLDAIEAHRLGLVDQLHEPALLAAQVEKYTVNLCSKSQFSIRTQKKLLNDLRPVAENPERFVRAFQDAALGVDCVEGRSAFQQKREPRFPYRG